ncbi:hypothetical protein TCAL_17247 [Tigriopus californicus]|uniref:Uncharacterized protein n=1 Tax=Tigriopus californicus TaxID=6832 RepID=A0A553NZN4_TIGCA|nr:hypothetical protein TCAL_17247 [Tigriopus californicus]
MPPTSHGQCFAFGVAGGFASAAAIAIKIKKIKKKLTPPPTPPPIPIAPQPVAQPLQLVNAVDVFPELGQAPRGVPQPGQFGGGALPFARDNASAESLGLVPDGFVPVAIFPPFQNARTRADAVGVIFSEMDDQSITVAGFDPADQVDFLNRRQPRFKRGIVQSLRHSVMSGLDRIRHRARRFWGIRHPRRDGYYQQPATLINQSNVRLNFIEVERHYIIRTMEKRVDLDVIYNVFCEEGQK